MCPEQSVSYVSSSSSRTYADTHADADDICPWYLQYGGTNSAESEKPKSNNYCGTEK